MSAGVVPFGIQGIFKAGTQVILTSKVSFLHICFLLFSFSKVLVQEVSVVSLILALSNPLLTITFQ